MVEKAQYRVHLNNRQIIYSVIAEGEDAVTILNDESRKTLEAILSKPDGYFSVDTEYGFTVIPLRVIAHIEAVRLV